MTQEAVVTRLLPEGMAEVAVKRTTACGGNCGSCESCVFENELKTPALNRIEAKPGQKVLIRSESSKVFGAAMLVYVMPLLFFLFGYALAVVLGLSENLRIVFSFVFLLIGAVVLVLSQRRKKAENAITFEIVAFL
ncbi:MAG: SoxR reducing system RseC family protein [Oscillospiraceae bacterium]|nr:SoxR reducing system RseC family protein [Oscillospiraceae bacterium]